MEQKRCPGCMELVTEAVCPHCGYAQSKQNESHQLPAGTVLRGQYEIGKVLGQGGFGITYLGWDSYLDMAVAIKEFYPAAAVNRDSTQSLSVSLNARASEQNYVSSRERFLREAKTLAKLKDIPEIVGIQDFFTENNTAYIIMEYVQGMDLRHYVQQKGGKLHPKELLPLLEPVLHALASVHREGLVHRDVSPDNIMLQPDGRVKLLDFGAARDAGDSDADVDLAKSTEAILKHGFAPMEQYRSRGNLGPWTDQYGFCASIYYCLTGKVPPDAPARAMDEAQPDWAGIPELSDAQRAALEKGMEMRAKERFGSMEALYEALYQAKTLPENRAAEAPAQKTGKKKPWLAITAAILALAATAALWLGSRENTPEISMETQPAVIAPTETEAPTTEPTPTEAEVPAVETTAETTAPEPWEGNVMKKDALDELVAFGLTRYAITSVTFLDTLENAPEDAVDWSEEQNGSVKAWIQWDSGCDLYIAAEGGINGRICCPKMFKDCENIKTVTFGGAFHTDEAVSMESMFEKCVYLEYVDAENLDTGNVETMNSMFSMYYSVEHNWQGTIPKIGQRSEKGLNNLDVSGWDVSNVRDMSNMFFGCNKLYSLDVSRWNVSNVEDASYLFSYCESLPSLDVSNWDVSNIVNMQYIFSHCTNLHMLDASQWNVSNVTNMCGMFFNCSNLQILDIHDWDVSNVGIMEDLFCGCDNIKYLDVSNWDVSNVKNMSWMFAYCSKLSILDVSDWDVSNVKRMNRMFYRCNSLTKLQIDNWDISNVERYDEFVNESTQINGKYWRLFFQK